MCFRVAPFPYLLSAINPDWVLLTLIYWTLMQPYQKGIFHAWAIGLLTDVLLGRTLGEYALIYSLICYFTIQFHKQLRQYPLIQQSIFIFMSLLLAQCLIFLLENIQSPTSFSALFWLPVLTGTLGWFAVYTALQFIRNLVHPY